jgi:hypothetical protein
VGGPEWSARRLVVCHAPLGQQKEVANFWKVETKKGCLLPAPACGIMWYTCPTQEKVYSPQQMSGLESLMVPPLAAAADWCRNSSSSCVLFGARLTTALHAAAAAASAAGAAGAPAAAAAAGPGQPGAQACPPGGLQGSQLQQVMGQQSPASSRHYMLFVTGSRRKVRLGCML